MEETLRQLHHERLARRQPEVFIPHIPPPPTDAELEARRQVAEESKVEERMEETKEEEPVEEEPVVEDCPVCLMPMETKHTLQCGHEICGDCPALMKTQDIGNGCVGLHAEADIKVIKCPICRKCDMPTREELIAEIVRIRRGGMFSRLASPPARRAPRAVVQPVPVPQNHNLPADIPVLQPVIQHNQPPAPAPAPINAQLVAQVAGGQPINQPAPVVHPQIPMMILPPLVAGDIDGRWLRQARFQPIRNNPDWTTTTLLPLPRSIRVWSIINGHVQQVATRVETFLNSGTRQNCGFLVGDHHRRFYHEQFFIPNETTGNVQARRLCNNGVRCNNNQQSRTARRCLRGCGQFICQACYDCDINVCLETNSQMLD